MKYAATLLVFFTSLSLFAQTAIVPQNTIQLDKVSSAPAPDDYAVELASTITASDLREHLTIIASDDMEGRETGQPGQKRAAQYIADHFKKLQLPAIGENGGYYQTIAFTAESWETIDLSVGGKKFRHLWDFYSFPGTNTDRETEFQTKNIVFLGYGIESDTYNDYAGVDVKGKTLLVYGGEPTDADGNSYVTGSKELSDWSTEWRKKLSAAHRNGASNILIIDPEIKKSFNEQRRFLLSPRMRIGKGEEPEGKYANNLFVSTDVAKALIGRRFKKVVRAREAIKANGKAKNVKLKSKLRLTQNKNVRQLLGENVLGYFEGSDPALKDQLVVVTAHYDHLGTRGQSIYNGADDNGTGTSTVLEITSALAQAKSAGRGPRRSVLCMLVSGEEKGLLGSKYYAENPIFPLENTVANVNVDMIGRTDEQHANNPNYVYVIGSDRLSTELHEINETANKKHTQIDLDYTYNEDDDPNRYYYRSDHYNFAEKGIPAIFYFSGTHVDYHQPTDTVDKIEFEKMENIGRLVFHTMWELANRDKRIEVNVTGRN